MVKNFYCKKEDEKLRIIYNLSKDRAKNVYAHVDQPIHLNSRGWHTDYDPGLGGSDWQGSKEIFRMFHFFQCLFALKSLGSYNSLYFSKTHNEVSRSQSDQAPSNNEKTFLQLLNSSPGFVFNY